MDIQVDHVKADFQPIQPGDLLIILGNTFHGGSAHSSEESDPRSRSLYKLHDLKFFIHCPGLNDATNPGNGTVGSGQLFVCREDPQFIKQHLQKYGSFQPAFYEELHE